MSSQPPSTPVKVPQSAANYTNATLDPDLRSQINQILIKDGHVTKIQDHLLHSLHAHQSNWPTTVQNHALNLLRSGEVTTFPALLRRVIEDVRQDTTLAPKATNGAAGSAEVNGNKKAAANGTITATDASSGNITASNGTTTTPPNLAVPQAVVEDALRVTRESLETVCEIEDSGSAL